MAQYLPPEDLRVGNGTETVFGFTFPYLRAQDIALTVNGVATPIVLVGTAQVSITPAPANGAQIRIYRNTPAQFPQYLFATGVPMLPKYIDENNRQLLYALQEGLLEFSSVQQAADDAIAIAEGAVVIANGAVATANQAVANIGRSVRAPNSDAPISALPPAAARANRMLGFNSSGDPVVLVPESGTVGDFAVDLANNTTPGLGASLVGYAGRDVYQRLQDTLSVLDYITTPVDGVTSNQAGIQAAVDAAKARGCALLWPAYLADYVSDGTITGFHDVTHVGVGAWLKRGTARYQIENSGENRNILYTAPTGTGDGLSDAQPAAITSVFDYLKAKGPVLGGRWRVQLAAGTYPRVPTQITGFSAANYIEVHGPAVSYGTPTAIVDAASAAWGLYFTGAFSVWFKDVKGINATGGSVAAAFICDNMNICFADNVHTNNTQWAGVNANNCSRLIAYGGRYENSVSSGLKGYGGTLVSIGRDGFRPQFHNCATGVELQGGAYGHVDYCDYFNCATGVEGTYQVHASVYQSTFTNCPVAIECDEQSSNINTDAFTLANMVNVGVVMRCVGSPQPSSRRYESQYWPFNGVNGRSSYGYTAYTAPTVKFQYSKDGTTAGFNLSALVPATALYESSGNTILALAAPTASYSAIWFANAVSERHCELRASSGTFSMLSAGAVAWSFSTTRLAPGTDNTQPIGSASLRPSVIFAGTGTINTSDERCKQDIQPIDERCLAAWARVEYTQYRFKDAAEAKGAAGSRWHFGLIAQRVQAAFEAEGLNAFDYGLLCYDEWDYSPEIQDESGEVVQAEILAGNRYGIRYEEALALECAYLRSLLTK